MYRAVGQEDLALGTALERATRLSQQLERYPRRAKLWVQLAQALRELDQPEQARFALRNALTLAPKHKAARRELVAVEQQLDRAVREAPITELPPWEAVSRYGPGSGSPRPVFTTHVSWAVPSPAAIEALVAVTGEGRLLEVGAGLGFWSRLLRDQGVQVIATDSFSTHQREAARAPWTAVLREEAVEAVHHHPADVLLLCWPPPKGSMATDALRAFRGRVVAYVGERGPHRVTGESTFFEALADGWIETSTVQIPNWPGFSDALTFYARA